MTFGEQVDEAGSHALLDRAVAAGINLLDLAEMYPVPARAETFGRTEEIVGRWLQARPGLRERLVIATKVAGPSRGYDWIRDGSQDLTGAQIIQACEDSLRRLRIDTIDLFQIHWPARHVPMFGGVYFEPSKDKPVASMLQQLQALDQLRRAGKIRHVGLSNETAYGVGEFVHLAQVHGLPRIVSVQNPYSLVNRVVAPEALSTESRALATQLAGSPPLAVRAIKRAVRDGLAGTLDDALARERKGQLALLGSADAREGVSAFFERRPPIFQGR